MLTVQQLQDGHKDARLSLSDSLSHYSANRASIISSMVAKGRKEGDAEQLLDAYESLWVPSFSTGSSRAMPNSNARREYDAALRSAVGPEAFDRFTGSLLEYRRAQQTVADINDRLYKAGGHQLYERAENEAQTVEDLRADIIKSIKKMNPTADINVFLKGLDGDQEQVSFDPVRKTVAIALDADSYDPDAAVDKSVFTGLTHVLSEKERKILDEAFSTFDQVSTDNGKTWRALASGESLSFLDQDPKSGLAQLKDADGNVLGLVQHKKVLSDTERTAERAAKAFAQYRTGKLKPPALAERALKPFNVFFERLGNLARGRGFQTVSDIYDRVASGDLGIRAQAQAEAPGLRMPLPKDNKALYEQTKASLGKMTNFELAAAVRKQKEACLAKRQDMKSWRKQLFTHSAIARKASSAVNYLSSRGEDALAADLREMNELQRGLAALKAEARHRANQTVSTGLDVPPPPPAQRYSDVIAATIARDIGQSEDVRLNGRFAEYQVTASTANPDFPMDVGMRTPGSDDAVQIGMAASAGGAAALINAIEQIGQGAVSMEANTLAVEASRAGTEENRDISTILQSGLVDPDLNDAISRKDVMAFVYPLKTGDVIFQTDDGRWLAARADNFLKFVQQVNDPHLTAAASVIQDNVVPMPSVEQEPRTRDLGAVSPDPQGISPARPGVSPSGPSDQPDPAAPSQAMAASLGVKPLALAEGREPMHQLKSELNTLSDTDLTARLKATQDAIRKIQPDAPRMQMQERRSFMRAENALLEVLSSRGVEVKPFETGSQSQSQKPRTNSPKR